MGGGQSVQLDIRTLSSQQIVDYIVNRNASLAKYYSSLTENDISGRFIVGLKEAEIDDIIQALNVDNPVHKRAFKVLFEELSELNASKQAADAIPPSSFTTSNIVADEGNPTTDVFLTHDWGTNEDGSSNHEIVSKINLFLKKNKVNTWFVLFIFSFPTVQFTSSSCKLHHNRFDEDRMAGNVQKMMADGIKHTKVLNCKLFTYV